MKFRVERFGLGHGARETVEDEAVVGLRVLQPLGDDPDQHLVRDQVAAVHVLLGLLADVGLVLDRGAQDVTGRVVRQFEVLLEAFALGSFAATGRSEEYEVEVGIGFDRVLRLDPRFARYKAATYFRKPS